MEKEKTIAGLLKTSGPQSQMAAVAIHWDGAEQTDGQTGQSVKKGDAHQSEWLRSKSLQVINAGEGVEKREPSYTVGGNAN